MTGLDYRPRLEAYHRHQRRRALLVALTAALYLIGLLA